MLNPPPKGTLSPGSGAATLILVQNLRLGTKPIILSEPILKAPLGIQLIGPCPNLVVKFCRWQTVPRL